MFYLIRTDGSFEVVPGAMSAGLEGEDLVCRDESGDEVGRFHKLSVLIYGDKATLERYTLVDDRERRLSPAKQCPVERQAAPMLES